MPSRRFGSCLCWRSWLLWKVVWYQKRCYGSCDHMWSNHGTTYRRIWHDDIIWKRISWSLSFSPLQKNTPGNEASRNIYPRRTFIFCRMSCGVSGIPYPCYLLCFCFDSKIVFHMPHRVHFHGHHFPISKLKFEFEFRRDIFYGSARFTFLMSRGRRVT